LFTDRKWKSALAARSLEQKLSVLLAVHIT